MYPGVIIEYNDNSEISSLPINEVRNRPLFGALFTSDKGPEAWTRVHGKEFFDIFGKSISFSRHGQPLLQAAMTINAGGELLCKRLVADDATLANIGIVASVSSSESQAADVSGNLIYLDADGKETTAVTETPKTVSSTSVSYSIKSATNVKTTKEAYDAIKATLAEGEYLIYVIGDNGRGTSKKRIKIIPNYRISKSLSYMIYTLYVLEGSSESESMTFSINPNLIVNDQNISLPSMISRNSKQLTCISNDADVDAFVEALASAEGVDLETMYAYDPLFGRTNRGEALSTITLSTDGIDLQYTYGQMLQSGSNGAFGLSPISTIETSEEYSKQAIAALDGSFDTVIFNVDQHKIDAFVDANYPKAVKRAIESLCVFREDYMYFRDQGLGVNNIDLVQEICAEETKSMFCSTYPQSYDIIDPYSKRQISVTIGYTLAQLLVAHCNNGRILPTAGMKHKMVISDAIYGTLSFSPTVCPDPEGDQKEKLTDLGVNYASYIDNQLVIETLNTTHTKYSQWSFINNVMGIQEVVKAIRTRCPAIRYTFIEGEDLERYKADVEEIIAPYKNNFKQLEFEYITDATYSANKIFYATLKVVYKDFVQTEWFKITALSTVEVLNQ